MNRYLKYLLITLSLSAFMTSTNVFAKKEDKKENFFRYRVECHTEDKNLKEILKTNENYYENVGNLAVYSLLHNVPDISKEALKNIVLSWNDLYMSRNYYLNTYLISEKDKKKIESYYKDIAEKIKKIEKKKDSNDELEKYIKKIVEEKNINFEQLKNKYIKLINKTKEEIKENLKNLKKVKKDDKFYIEFEKEKLLEKEEKYEKPNILKKMKFKNDKELIEDGKKTFKSEIKCKELLIKKLNKDIEQIKKIKKKHFNEIRKEILINFKRSIFSSEWGNKYDLRIYFKNGSFHEDIYKYFYLKYFHETLEEELKKFKDKKCVKNEIKEREKELKDMLKSYKDDKSYKNYDAKTLEKHLRYYNGYIIKHPTFCTSPYFFDVDFYEKNLEFLKIITKIIKSDKFKTKLKKNLTKERFEKLKKDFLKNVNFEAKNDKISYEKATKENTLELGKKDIKERIKYKKEHLKNLEKQNKEKDIYDKYNIKHKKKSIKEDEETLKDKEHLKEIGEKNKQNDIDEFKYRKKENEYILKQIKNCKLENMKKALNTIKYDEEKISITKNSN